MHLTSTALVKKLTKHDVTGLRHPLSLGRERGGWATHPETRMYAPWPSPLPPRFPSFWEWKELWQPTPGLESNSTGHPVWQRGAASHPELARVRNPRQRPARMGRGPGSQGISMHEHPALAGLCCKKTPAHTPAGTAEQGANTASFPCWRWAQPGTGPGSLRQGWSPRVLRTCAQPSEPLSPGPPREEGLLAQPVSVTHSKPRPDENLGTERWTWHIPAPSWASLVVQMVKNLPAVRETRVWSLGWEDPLEEDMATHSSILAWRIPWTEEPGGLQPVGVTKSWTRLSD